MRTVHRENYYIEFAHVAKVPNPCNNLVRSADRERKEFSERKKRISERKKAFSERKEF